MKFYNQQKNKRKETCFLAHIKIRMKKTYFIHKKTEENFKEKQWS